MSSASAQVSKRLMGELRNYTSNLEDCLEELEPVDSDDLLHWTAILKGVPGTPYERGRWKIDIQVPETYPYTPPEVKFVTPICHPNINLQTGEICLDLLKTDWTPAYTLASTLTAVHTLLTSPEPNSPLNVDAAALLRAGDTVGYESLVRAWVAMYATHW